MPEGRVTVVIVNYNAGTALRECLHSVLSSDTRLETIVVDNHSTDGSVSDLPDLETGDHTLQFIHNSRNLGFAAAFNRGFRQSTGEYIVLLNPDCIVQSHSVRKLADSLAGAPDAGITGGLVFNFDGTEQRGCRRRHPTLCRSAAASLGSIGRRLFRDCGGGIDMSRETLPAEPVTVDAVSGAFMVIRRDLLNRTGGLDESYFLHCEDLDICRQAAQTGRRVVFDPSVSVFHRQGISGRGRRVRVEWHKHRGMIRYYRKFEGCRASFFAVGGVALLIGSHFAVVACTLMLRGLMRRHSPHDSQSSRACLAPTDPQTLVTGATSNLGPGVIDRLTKNGHRVIATARSRAIPPRGPAMRSFRAEYLHKAPKEDIGPVVALVHLAPIWTLPEMLPRLAALGVRRVVAISSTSVLSKRGSADPADQQVVSLLAAGEEGVREAESRLGIACTILRPTIIYTDGGRDGIGLIASFVRRFRFFPMIGEGRGLRQPVHADDVASACISVLERPGTAGRTYELTGGETVGYREMVTRIFRRCGLIPRFLTVPAPFMRGILTLAGKLPGKRHFSPSMADRMNVDLCFSTAAAKHDFGYAPRPFLR